MISWPKRIKVDAKKIAKNYYGFTVTFLNKNVLERPFTCKFQTASDDIKNCLKLCFVKNRLPRHFCDIINAKPTFGSKCCKCYLKAKHGAFK